jgi:hypothetical protein
VPRHRASTPRRWPAGACDFLEDPRLDARDAHPVWIDALRSPVRLTHDASDRGPRFSLWDVPGVKALAHDGSELVLKSSIGRRFLCLALARRLRDDMPYAYTLPAGASRRGYRTQLDSVVEFLEGDQAKDGRAERPSRSAIVHMRALQALDGVLAGASQREIAGVLFGRTTVAQRWEPDGEMRAQIRYLLRRARAVSDGGYRDLLRGGAPGENLTRIDSP